MVERVPRVQQVLDHLCGLVEKWKKKVFLRFVGLTYFSSYWLLVRLSPSSPRTHTTNSVSFSYMCSPTLLTFLTQQKKSETDLYHTILNYLTHRLSAATLLTESELKSLSKKNMSVVEAEDEDHESESEEEREVIVFHEEWKELSLFQVEDGVFVPGAFSLWLASLL